MVVWTGFCHFTFSASWNIWKFKFRLKHKHCESNNRIKTKHKIHKGSTILVSNLSSVKKAYWYCANAIILILNYKLYLCICVAQQFPILQSSAIWEVSSTLTMHRRLYLAGGMPRVQCIAIKRDYVAKTDQLKNILISPCLDSAYQLLTHILAGSESCLNFIRISEST